MQVSASTEENTEISEDIEEKLQLNVPHPEQEQDESEEEFSFACASPGQSPVSADDAFLDGQIRPIFPIFDQSLLYRYSDGDMNDDSKQTLRPPLRKLFFEEQSEPEEEEEPVGPYCEWSPGGGNKTVKEDSPEHVKKSNSTGFSMLWRFRELVLRSNSDGKDAFVFLNNNNNNNSTAEKSRERPARSSEKPTGPKATPAQKTSQVDKVINSNNKRVKAETVSSVYEKYYVKNRVMREGDRRRSYAPYRQDLVGFFTNVNGFSRNVHPF